MSTLQATNLKHNASASNNIVLDSSGNATFAGTAVPSSSFLRNRIINGDMRIDQRNAGAAVTINAAANTYVMDRWLGGGQATDGVFTIQRSTVAPAGFSNSALITVTTADASIGATQAYYFRQPIEGFNTADLSFGSASAQSVTLSFWVRSSVTGTFGGAINNSAFNRSYPFSFTISAANTWEYKTVTISGDTTGTWLTDNGIGLAVTFSLGMGSTYKGTAGSWSGSLLLAPTGAVDLISTNSATFYVTGVQLEVGSAATPFERRHYGQEMVLCQRYFEKSYDTPTAVGTITTSGNFGMYCSGASSFFNGIGSSVGFATEKRTITTITTYSPATGASGKMRDIANGTDINSFVAYNNTRSFFCYGQPAQNSNVNVYFQWTASAEL